MQLIFSTELSWEIDICRFSIVRVCANLYGEMVDCAKSDKMMKINRKVD